MRTKLYVPILVLLALTLPASPAQAGGVVTICDEAHLRAALAGGGKVTFSCNGTISLISPIGIEADTAIDGTGQDVIISGNNTVRGFTLEPEVTVSLNGLTIANGRGAYGGGIYNEGTLTVSNSTFSGNTASHGGGGIYCTNLGTLTVYNSTFTGNSADAGRRGGGISNINCTLTVSNSTFSGNSAERGGGIAATIYGTAEVSNSTFSGNTASAGGGIYNNGGTVTLKNTIVANSPIGSNCYGIINDGGGNLSYPDATCPGINTDPLLGPVQNNGGPTETMALGPGSAAIDAGDDAICAAEPVNGLDQRGVTRPQGAHCDIGAVEQITEPSAVRLNSIGAGRAPNAGAVRPVLIVGLLLITLASIGAYWQRTENRSQDGNTVRPRP